MDWSDDDPRAWSPLPLAGTLSKPRLGRGSPLTGGQGYAGRSWPGDAGSLISSPRLQESQSSCKGHGDPSPG